MHEDYFTDYLILQDYLDENTHKAALSQRLDLHLVL